MGVGRPDTTDPEIVSAHVLGRFSEPPEDVRALVEKAADELDRLVTKGATGDGLTRNIVATIRGEAGRAGVEAPRPRQLGTVWRNCANSVEDRLQLSRLTQTL